MEEDKEALILSRFPNAPNGNGESKTLELFLSPWDTSQNP